MKPSSRYATPVILLHWLVALLIIGVFIVGLKLWGMPLSPAKFKWMAWHKWVGLTILALVLVRLLLRMATRVPPLPEHMSLPAQKMAHLGHLALYLLMLAVPLSGWAMSSAFGIPIVYFGVLPLPELLAPDMALAPMLKTLHQGLNLALAAAVAGHILVALKHHFIDRDGLLFRMSLRRPTPQQKEKP